MTRWNGARLLLSLVAVFTVVSPYIWDWNVTHIYNPHWPPHAKFHNAQTMLLGSLLGLCALWVLWGWKTDRKNQLGFGLIFAGAYWLTQAGSILFPGTALVDPEFAYRQHGFNQLGLDTGIFVLLAMALGLGWNGTRETVDG